MVYARSRRAPLATRDYKRPHDAPPSGRGVCHVQTPAVGPIGYVWLPQPHPPQDGPAPLRRGSGYVMAYARVTVHYRDKSSTVIEVGHAAACHPDLLDELVARCRALYVDTIGEDDAAEIETEPGE